MEKSLRYYALNAQALSNLYESTTFEKVHEGIVSLIPNRGYALDIGAGSGRDAAYLAQLGLNVVAVEPVAEMISIAQASHPFENITWVPDKLPELAQVKAMNIKFDFVLLSGVWMHIAPNQRLISLQNLVSLLSDSGILSITLRQTRFNDERTYFPMTVQQLKVGAEQCGLNLLRSSEKEPDKLGRLDTQWETVCFRKKVKSAC